MSDTTESRVGTQFGPYRLKRLLGRGGMGAVYEAEHTVKEWTVAVKLMAEEFSTDPVFRKRMEREARIAGKLQEPHVVPIHEYGEIDGQLYLEMRLIEGTDLFSLLKRYGPLTPPRAVAIIRQVASALDAAHAAGVMHRDVKPENVLITGDDFAYLVDFGIASATTDERLTQMGSAVGTWKYMAPERFGKEEVTYRADIYALACVLHECLTGSPPYPADTTGQLVASHMLEPIPRPSQVRPGTPAAFDAVIARGMAKKPADRYASCGDLALAAHQALSAPAQDKAENILRRTEAALPDIDLAASLQSPTPSGSQPQPTLTPPPSSSQPQPTLTPPPGWTLTPPPSSQPQPERKRLSRRTWIILAGGGLAIVAAIVVVVMTVLKPSAPPVRTVTSEDMDIVMLNGGVINSIMGAYDIESDKVGREAIEPTYTVSPPDCLGAVFAAQAPVYSPSGYTALNYLAFQEPGNDIEHAVTEAVAIFPSADKASAFVQSSAGNWKTCAGQTVTVTDKVNSANSDRWTVGTFTGNAPQISQKLARVNTDKNGKPWVCEHALRAVSNVVADVTACGYHVSDEAGRIADEMAAKVTK